MADSESSESATIDVPSKATAFLAKLRGKPRRRPLGFGWRSSYWFTTFMVGLGVATDLLTYTIIIPVMPFHLEKLGYTSVSARAGWLLFAYSAGVVLSTIPIAIFSERYSMRKAPLLFGLVALLGSQVMLMEAPTYPLMCIARILQGVSSSVIWVVGLALLCDVVPEAIVGRQLGIALSGLSLGQDTFSVVSIACIDGILRILIGPPVGGSLYAGFGYRAPFVFAMGAAVLDMIARLLIIERKDALNCGIDPKIYNVNIPKDSEKGLNQGRTSAETIPKSSIPGPSQPEGAEASREVIKLRHVTVDIAKEEGSSDSPSLTSRKPYTESTNLPRSPSPAPSTTSAELHSRAENLKIKPISLPVVIVRLSKSSRAVVSLLITFVYGVVYTSQEPSLPLHLQRVWGLHPGKVGLIFLAGLVPSLFSPLTGWLSDTRGAEWVTFIFLLLALPWWVLVIIQGHLAFFTIAFAMETFFTTGVVSPLTAELAAVSRGIKGVGYAHVYGAFNIAYGIGSTVGPLMGGQIYDNVNHGWTALCLIATGLLALSLVIAFFFTGDDPLARKFTRALGGEKHPDIMPILQSGCTT